MRDALFSLPRRVCRGLTTASAGGELPDSTLALATQLHIVHTEVSPTNAFRLNQVSALPSLPRLPPTPPARLWGSSRCLPSRASATCCWASTTQPGTEPTQAQLPAILEGVTAGLMDLSLEHFVSSLQTLVDMGGLQAFPRVTVVSLEQCSVPAQLQIAFDKATGDSVL